MSTKKHYDTREVVGTLVLIGSVLYILFMPVLLGKVFSWPFAARTIYLSLLTALVLLGFYLSIKYAWYFLVTLPRETRRLNAELEEYSKRLRELNARNPKNKERNTRRRRKKRK